MRKQDEPTAEAADFGKRYLRQQGMGGLYTGLFFFTVGGGLFLLSYADWIPEGLAAILAVSESRTSSLAIAGMGLAVAVYSIVYLGTYRPGAEADDRRVLIWLLLAFGAASTGAIAVLAWFPSESVSVFSTMLAFGLVLFMPVIMTAWIERSAKVLLPIFAVVALAVLCAAYVAWR